MPDKVEEVNFGQIGPPPTSGTQKQFRYWSSDFKYHSSLRSYSPLGNSLVGLAHQSPIPRDSLSERQVEVQKPSDNILPNRNDADVLGIRNGCTFTGWTGSGYDGETFTATAGPGPRDR